MEMKELLMIPEQINTILFGMTYTKKAEFVKSPKFEEIVDCLFEFEKKELKIDAEEIEDEPEEVNFAEDDKEIHENDTNTFKNGNQRRDEIARDVTVVYEKMVTDPQKNRHWSTKKLSPDHIVTRPRKNCH